MSLVTVGWVLWPLILTASLAGVYYDLRVRPRRERRLADLIEIVTQSPSVFWAPDDWLEDA